MLLSRAIEPGDGVVIQPIAPKRSGRVRFQGIEWKAELAHPGYRKVGSGEWVRVVGMQGIRLLVVPENSAV